MCCLQPGAKSHAAAQGTLVAVKLCWVCPLTGCLEQWLRSCWRRAALLHAEAHFKGRAGTSAGSTGEYGLLALLSSRQLLIYSVSIQGILYGCGGKGSPAAWVDRFGSKVVHCLSWWSWTLFCGAAVTGRAQGGVSGHRALMSYLEGSALPA